MKRLILIFVLCGVLLPSAYGEAISYTFPSGNKYVGEVKNGQQHGWGTFRWANGEMYVGEWRNGMRHGQGTQTYDWSDRNHKYKNLSNEIVSYDGEWRNDKQHGQGTSTREDGTKYIGEWRNDKSHGLGTVFFPNGARTVGEWRDGKPWTATMYRKDGVVVVVCKRGRC